MTILSFKFLNDICVEKKEEFFFIFIELYQIPSWFLVCSQKQFPGGQQFPDLVMSAAFSQSCQLGIPTKLQNISSSTLLRHTRHTFTTPWATKIIIVKDSTRKEYKEIESKEKCFNKEQGYFPGPLQQIITYWPGPLHFIFDFNLVAVLSIKVRLGCPQPVHKSHKPCCLGA